MPTVTVTTELNFFGITFVNIYGRIIDNYSAMRVYYNEHAARAPINNY